jgi:hemoglobin
MALFSRPSRTRALVLAVPMLLGACSVFMPLKSSNAKPTVSLYTRLGGYDAIAAVTDDFLGRALADPKIVPYFKGLEPKDIQRVRQHVVDQLCNAAGGPCYYPGKDMKTAHAEMEINNDIWNAFTGHLNETVVKFKIPERERNELVVIVGSLRGSIVNR